MIRIKVLRPLNLAHGVVPQRRLVVVIIVQEEIHFVEFWNLTLRVPDWGLVQLFPQILVILAEVQRGSQVSVQNNRAQHYTHSQTEVLLFQERDPVHCFKAQITSEEGSLVLPGVDSFHELNN